MEIPLMQEYEKPPRDAGDAADEAYDEAVQEQLDERYEESDMEARRRWQ